MTYCITGNGPCQCQPSEGVFCHDNEAVAELQRQLEQAEARVAELEGQPTVVQLSELMRGLEIGPGFATMPPYIFYVTGKHIAEQAKAASDSAILRKQAEAADEINHRLTMLSEETSERMSSQLVTQYCASIAGEEAQRLRQQADEAEKAGGSDAS